METLDLTRINRLAPYKVWTENGRDDLIETISILTNKPKEANAG